MAEPSSTRPMDRGCGGAAPPEEPRRGFLGRLIALGLGAAAYLTPVVAGLAAFLNPLRQKSQTGQFVRLASLETLDGTPRKVAVIMDRTDAWNLYPQQPVGAVWLRKVGPKEVQALHIVCPHAGCFIDYDAGAGQFMCPCHLAHFDLEGKRLEANSPSPRDMDALEVDYETHDGVTYVRVKFQNFRIGTPEKIEA